MIAKAPNQTLHALAAVTAGGTNGILRRPEEEAIHSGSIYTGSVSRHGSG